jgi:galactokinase
LASHSYAEESSPIHRGVFTARKILGRSLRPPTEAVSFRNADFNPNWTMREKVTELTKAANCMSCHDQINSSGFVLESFDAAGKFRTHIQGKPIDLKVHYLDSKGENQVFTNANDLLQHALRSSQSAKSFINELFKHLAKQSALSYDNLDIETLSNMLNEGQLSIQDLYLKLCFKGASDGFVFAK